MAALPGMLEDDRKRAGWSVEQASGPGGRSSRRRGVSVRTYREIEAGERAPTWETWDRICKTFGWGQTFVGPAGDGRSAVAMVGLERWSG